jgi:hypothetical protein
MHFHFQYQETEAGIDGKTGGQNQNEGECKIDRAKQQAGEVVRGCERLREEAGEKNLATTKSQDIKKTNERNRSNLNT